MRKASTLLAMAAALGMSGMPMPCYAKGYTSNRHKPHQSTKECARRVRQMCGVKLECKPRRVWVLNNSTQRADHVSLWRWEIKWPTRKPLIRLGKLSRFPVVLK
jgi:hypothetical protein